MPKSKKVQIYDALKTVITDDPIDWSDIVSHLKEEDLKISNWLVVRDVLQFMLNEKMVARVDSIVVEQYYKL